MDQTYLVGYSVIWNWHFDEQSSIKICFWSAQIKIGLGAVLTTGYIARLFQGEHWKAGSLVLLEGFPILSAFSISYCWWIIFFFFDTLEVYMENECYSGKDWLAKDNSLFKILFFIRNFKLFSFLSNHFHRETKCSENLLFYLYCWLNIWFLFH